MNFWYTTCGGDTVHNKPGTPNYVEGEPPIYPKVKIDYSEKCLKEGFARFGYPNTGSLDPEELGSRRLAPNGYTFDTVETVSNNSPLTKSQLLGFASIKAGDFILIPSPDEIYNLHFGMVLTKERKSVEDIRRSDRPNAYYYQIDDYFECAHRVNVQWAKEQNGEFAEVYVPKIPYRLAFCQLHEDIGRLLGYVKKYGFW